MTPHLERTCAYFPAQWWIHTDEGRWFAHYREGEFALSCPGQDIEQPNYTISIRDSEDGQMTDETLRLVLVALRSMDSRVPVIVTT